MSKKFYSLFLTLLTAFLWLGTGTVWGEELTVADGTAPGTTATTNKYAPIYGYYCDGLIDHMQMIYPADMISDLAKGPITDITFYSTTATQSWGTARFDVKLAVVSESTLSA
ncbi:MAG: hypothetical protein II457_03740, partial [Paludibacteraceae bacterium]|nr:hypothetical protein [Paludibacteraceae bacterium]